MSMLVSTTINGDHIEFVCEPDETLLLERRKSYPAGHARLRDRLFDSHQVRRDEMVIGIPLLDEPSRSLGPRVVPIAVQVIAPDPR